MKINKKIYTLCIALGIALLSLCCVNIVNAQDIIISDNGDSGTSYTGIWQVSGGENPYGTDSLWSRDGATYTWHADLPQAGVYEVYMWWTNYSNRGDSAPVTIEYDGGSQVVYVNQTQNGGMWNLLSTYSFDAATGGTVTITADDPFPITYCADAVKFVYVSDQAAPSIIGYAPEDAEVNDTVGAERTFNITVNQTVNVRDMLDEYKNDGTVKE